MAELQWIIEVRCINILLAEVKVGEKGEYVIVNIPDRNFLPSELDKLIKAFEIASGINEENKYAFLGFEKATLELGEYVEVIDKRNIAEINILSTGELVNINVPEKLITPLEAKKLLEVLKAVRYKMVALRVEK